MARSRHSLHPGQIPFKIEASRANSKVGDRVKLETPAGMDFETGKDAAAGFHGAVVGVNFLGGEHMLRVFIRPDSR